jgi:hypothetical protein
MNLKHFVLIFLIFFTKTSFGTLALNVGVIHKRGIDKRLTLVSELYSRKEVSEGQKIELLINLGIKLKLQVTFNDDKTKYGPSEKVIIKAELHLPSGNILTQYSETPLVAKLGEKNHFVYKRGKDQLIEITIQPEVI